MNRLLLACGAFAIVGGAVLLSRSQQGQAEQGKSNEGIQVTSEAKNPWTNLKVNSDPDQFQFAIITDRTGGHRAKVFARAVQQINLLQPEFVLSVGDLIEGYTTKGEKIEEEWKEFNGYVNQLEMPFFYVPGNHDLTNKEQNDDWKNRFGRKYYHFVYKNVLFLAVNSEDGAASTVSKEQTEYFRKVLDENKNVRWTMVFLHKPLWVDKDLEKNGWAPLEKTLEGRKYTVFCGHVHRYQKFVRNGMNYYQLATTGGGSRLRGVEYGEFDHITWMTMKKDGPRMANVVLDGVLPENLNLPDNNEQGTIRKLPKIIPFEGLIQYKGKPLAGATVTFWKKELYKPKADSKEVERTVFVCDGWSNANGKFQMTTASKFDGVPVGEYIVTVFRTEDGSYYNREVSAKSTLPAKFADAKTSGLKAEIKDIAKNEIVFSIED